MNIHKFDNIPEKPFHSSSYAEVANGGSIGSTNGQTFGQRYSADQNRSVVRKYRDSHIGRGSLRHQARVRTALDPFRRIDPLTPVSRQAKNATSDPSVESVDPPSASPPVMPRANFKEPPARGFNPYA